LFALSEPLHRKAAREYWIAGRRGGSYRDQFYKAAGEYEGLIILFNSVSILWPGISVDDPMADRGGFDPGRIPYAYPPKQKFPEWCAANGVTPLN